MNRNHLLAMILLVITLGCVTVSTSMLPGVTTEGYYYAPESVHVFFDTDELDPSCVRVAILNAKGDADWTGRGGMLRELRKKAGEAGANAIQLRGNMEEPGTGARDRRGTLGHWC